MVAHDFAFGRCAGVGCSKTIFITSPAFVMCEDCKGKERAAEQVQRERAAEQVQRERAAEQVQRRRYLRMLLRIRIARAEISRARRDYRRGL